jgi:hypothetical protein
MFDLYRAVEVAKSFEYEAPRATVTLAIACSILVREADGSIKPGAQAPGSQLIRKNTSPR